MRAPAVSDLAARLGPALGAGSVLRFALVGVGATLLYAVLAALLSSGDPATLHSSAASVAAYAMASVFSYAGHRVFTFVSGGAHRVEAPRFVVLTLSGLAVSFALPAIVTGAFDGPVAVSIALTCLLVPVINYFALRLWVFSDAGGGAQGR